MFPFFYWSIFAWGFWSGYNIFLTISVTPEHTRLEPTQTATPTSSMTRSSTNMLWATSWSASSATERTKGPTSCTPSRATVSPARMGVVDTMENVKIAVLLPPGPCRGNDLPSDTRAVPPSAIMLINPMHWDLLVDSSSTTGHTGDPAERAPGEFGVGWTNWDFNKMDDF